MDVKFVKPFFSRRQAVVLARQHRPLARHRRHGAGRLLGQRHRGRAGGPAPAAGEALQAKARSTRRSSSIILATSASPTSASATSRRRSAALAIGEKRLTALLDRYGDETVDAAIVELKRRAARQMRAKIATIPDGIYEARPSSTPTASSTSPAHRHAHHQERRQRARRAALSLRHERLEPAVPGADEQRDRDDAGRRSTSPSSTSFRKCRSTPAPSSRCTSSIPTARSSTRAIRGRCRAAPPRSASASPRRCSRRSPRRSPTSCSARRRAPAATSASAASTRRRTGPTSCT